MGKTILVIEDDASVAEMLKDVLVREGFDVAVEADGEWGLRTFKERPFDLVILDVLIPKVQGFDLIPKLRASDRGAELPIVVMSGVFRGRTYKADMIQRFGVRAYFDKPLDIDQLLDALHDIFSSAYPEPTSGATEQKRVMPLVRPITHIDRGEPPPLDIPMRGELENVSFGRLLGGLFARRVTGALMLRRSSVKKIVYFTEGIPVFVKSNLLSECLGRVMVAERLITQDECDRSLERKKRETGRRQGEILVEMGCISQHNLEFALELQLQGKLFDAFSWRDGRYHFNPSADYRGPQVPLSMGPTTLVHEGASRQMDPKRVLADLETIQHRPLVISTEKSFRYQALQLDPRAERMIDRIDGRRTLHDLLTGADFPKAEAALVLYALVSTGLIRVVFVPPAEDPHLIALEEGDVQSLSTGEINAIAARRPTSAVVVAPPPAEPEPTPAPVDEAAEEPAPSTGDVPEPDAFGSLSRFERAVDASSTEPSQTPSAAMTPLESIALRGPPTPPPPPVDPETPLPARSELLGPAGISDAPKRRPLTRSSSLPRTGNWTSPSLRSAAPPEEPPTDAPELSDDVRRQVRERLEAEMMRLSEIKKRERLLKSQAPRRIPPKREERESLELDLEAERKRTEEELGTRYDDLSRKTFYELLEVPTNATADDIRTAYKKLAKKLDPDRTVHGTASHIARIVAEKIYLLATRALNTLTNDEARIEYDRLIGLDRGPRIAALFVAEEAFERGVRALAKGDYERAEAALDEAVAAKKDDGVYRAHRAWAIFSQHPDDAEVRAAALEALAAAAEASPRSEEALLYLGAVARKHGDKPTAVSAYQRAIEVNPDCTTALGAIRELLPPTEKKTGLLSRYFAG